MEEKKDRTHDETAAQIVREGDTMPLERVVETELITPDGTNLHIVQHRIPDATGTVLLVHGLGEHSGCYPHIIQLLNAAGMNVVRYDQRGHGKSSGNRGHIKSYANYLNDLSLVIDFLLVNNPDGLITLFGHSMGGGVVANWCLQRMTSQHEDLITGIVLSAPWFRLAEPPSDLKVQAIRAMSWIWPQFSIPTSIRSHQLSRSEEIRERLRNDEQRHNRITMRTAIECHLAGEWALQHAREFPVPVLAFHGTSDTITSCNATREFCERSPQAQFVPLPDLRHEPHSDPRWEEIFSHVVDWILRRLPHSLAA